MLDIVFGGLMGISLLWGLCRGTGDAVTAAALTAAGEAVQSAIALAGGFAFFCGLMNVLKRAGALEGLSRLLRPALIFLMGRELPEEAVPYAAMNLAANMLGLGNAATPMGIEAARRMASGERANNALCLFLVINSSSVQLLPSSVIALRAAAGSRDPGAVALPALLATGVSTLAGILACRIAEKRA
ncbi:MAG: spore maturation protein A [Clostridiales bacterium]|nr:spore maturation protein A [Clostridiales bacterium]